jgi:hypothetical protein
VVNLHNKNKREYTKEDYKRNGTKFQNPHSKNSTVYTIEEPALNESGIEAKKKGF